MAKRKKQNVVYVLEERRSAKGPWRVCEIEFSKRDIRSVKKFNEDFNRDVSATYPRAYRPVEYRIVRYGALEVVE